MKARVAQACQTYRFSLPWVLLRKMASNHVRFETIVIFSHGLHDPTGFRPKPFPAVQVQRISHARSELFTNLCTSFPNGNFASRLLDEGRECYVALHKDRISAYAWVANDSLHFEEIALDYPISKHEIFIYDCYVVNECRGVGIYPLLLGAVLKDQDARSTTLQRACIAASSTNQASIRGIRKAGFVEFKRIRYLEWNKRQQWWEQTLSSGLHNGYANENVDAEFYDS